MKRPLFKYLFFVFYLLAKVLIAQNISYSKWYKDPFDHKIFIQNAGQFSNDVDNKDTVLFQALLGDVKVYFTSSGVIYKYVNYQKVIGSGESDNMISNSSLISVRWIGSNANVFIEGVDEQPYYYSYPLGCKRSINAQLFKKIIYHNLYPGVDAEYTFPENKFGMKYSLIIHPGADISAIKLMYISDSIPSIDGDGNIVMNDSFAKIVDHAPVCYSQTNAEQLPCSFELYGNIESFKINKGYDTNEILVIDPWLTDPRFNVTFDKAYDVDYDTHGNVYAYGGGNPFQLTKFDSSGNQQWVFNASTISFQCYGDFATDKTTGTSYIVDGINGFTGAQVLKINSAGSLISTFPGDTNAKEMWRVVYNACSHQLVIGAGGSLPPYSQICLLDTDMVTMALANPLGESNSDCCHDVCLIGQDPLGQNAYLAVAQYNANFDNVLMSLPIPALTPAKYLVPDGLGFQHINSVKYVLATVNGFNGMAVSSNLIYTYNGETLQKQNKASGNIILSANIGTTPFYWGGLDVDLCNNVYAGNRNVIQEYDSNLTLIATIPAHDTVYDVVLGENYSDLYTCGPGYVQAISIPSGQVFSIASSPTKNDCCIGSATVKLPNCISNQSINPSYVWNTSPIQTTQTATGLCKGTYSVAVSFGCSNIYNGSIDIVSSVFPINIIGSTSIKEGQSTNLIAHANGGVPPYSFLWDGSTTDSSITVSPNANTTYTIAVTDSNGCVSTAYVTVDVLCGSVFIPNAFSPNGDGQNDILYIKGDCIKTMDFIVFDRWGNKVFETNNQSIGWNGTYIEKPMNTGTYVYYLTATMYDGTTLEKKGNVELVR